MAIKPQSSNPSAPADGKSAERLIGKGWLQGVGLVMIFGFFVMGILAYRTYTASMPMPMPVQTQSGQPTRIVLVQTPFRVSAASTPHHGPHSDLGDRKSVRAR